MKRINLKKVLAIGLKFIFIAIVFHVGYLTINANCKAKMVVEPYCAVRYEHNVVEYKQCKSLNPQELIEFLTDEAVKKPEIPNLPVIKEL